MIRKIFFWMHLSAGVVAGLFIFVMAATGVVLSFEKQIKEFIERDVRFVAAANEARRQPLTDQLRVVRGANVGRPTAIVVHRQAQAATEFSIGRGKTVYVDPYRGAVLGANSPGTQQFFSKVERWHRSLGAPLGSKNVGHWLVALSNLLFAALILPGLILWIPRKSNWQAVRARLAFRSGLRGKAREWNWHNAVGIWCALPLLVIALTGVVMSFEWANALLFRLAGSSAPSAGRRGGDRPLRGAQAEIANEPNYDQMLGMAETLNPKWRTITLNLARDEHSAVTVSIDTGAGGQPQNRTQYVLNRETGAVEKSIGFGDGSLGQRLRAFVRFGHTGEYGGLGGQAIAALASLGACVLVYSGLSLAIRRLAARIRRRGIDFPVHESERETAGNRR